MIVTDSSHILTFMATERHQQQGSYQRFTAARALSNAGRMSNRSPTA